jgi:hypothetical protein
MSAKIRKLVVQLDETLTEMGREVSPPVRRAVAAAVIENPFAAVYQEDLDELIAIGEELGGLLAARCVAALGIPGGQAQSYGKAAMRRRGRRTGTCRRPAAPQAGAPLRCARCSSKGAALVPSSKKRGGPGTVLDVPLGHKDAAYVRSHFDGHRERGSADAPRAREIVVAVAVTDSGRPLPRVGGLTAKHEIKGEDGLR